MCQPDETLCLGLLWVLDVLQKITRLFPVLDEIVLTGWVILGRAAAVMGALFLIAAVVVLIWNRRGALKPLSGWPNEKRR